MNDILNPCNGIITCTRSSTIWYLAESMFVTMYHSNSINPIIRSWNDSCNMSSMARSSSYAVSLEEQDIYCNQSFHIMVGSILCNILLLMAGFPKHNMNLDINGSFGTRQFYLKFTGDNPCLILAMDSIKLMTLILKLKQPWLQVLLYTELLHESLF